MHSPEFAAALEELYKAVTSPNDLTPLFEFRPEFRRGLVRDVEGSIYDLDKISRDQRRERRLSCPGSLTGNEPTPPPLQTREALRAGQWLVDRSKQPLPAGTGGDRDDKNNEVVLNFWPEILPVFRKWFVAAHLGIDKASLRIPTVFCTVCFTQLVISGLQPREPGSEQEQEDAVLTPCGHVVGRNCLDTWGLNCVTSRGGSYTFDCPVCRFNLAPPRCPAHDLGMSLPLREEKDEEFGLLTRGIDFEGPANVEAASRCPECRVPGGVSFFVNNDMPLPFISAENRDRDLRIERRRVLNDILVNSPIGGQLLRDLRADVSSRMAQQESEESEESEEGEESEEDEEEEDEENYEVDEDDYEDDYEVDEDDYEDDYILGSSW